MRFGDAWAELLAPTRCAGCEMPGALLCERCDTTLPRVEQGYACQRCGAPFGFLVCTECWSSEFAFEAAVSLGVLDGTLARAVVLHKDSSERRLGAVLGRMLAQVAEDAWPQWPDAVTWVPATRAAVKRRGFDHGRGIAAPVARAFGLEPVALLGRGRARDQRDLDKSDRARNVAGTFAVLPHVQLGGARVIVVDDVLTTGATLDAAADTLLSCGAASVRVAVIARTW